MQDANHLTPEDFYHFIDGGLDEHTAQRLERRIS